MCHYIMIIRADSCADCFLHRKVFVLSNNI